MSAPGRCVSCAACSACRSSGYDGWRARPVSARAVQNRALLEHVRRLHGRHHGRYGSPRMHAALRAEGWRVGCGSVGFADITPSDRLSADGRAADAPARYPGPRSSSVQADHNAARAAAPVIDMGPGRGDGQARRAAHRHRASRLLLRSPQSPPQPPGCGPSRHRIDGLLAINGSGRPARTRMGSCASTFRKAPTLARTQPTSSPP